MVAADQHREDLGVGLGGVGREPLGKDTAVLENLARAEVVEAREAFLEALENRDLPNQQCPACPACPGELVEILGEGFSFEGESGGLVPPGAVSRLVSP